MRQAVLTLQPAAALAGGPSPGAPPSIVHVSTVDVGRQTGFPEDPPSKQLPLKGTIELTLFQTSDVRPFKNRGSVSWPHTSRTPTAFAHRTEADIGSLAFLASVCTPCTLPCFASSLACRGGEEHLPCGSGGCVRLDVSGVGPDCRFVCATGLGHTECACPSCFLPLIIPDTSAFHS